MITECYSKNGCPCMECEKECCIEYNTKLTDTEKLCYEARVHCERCAAEYHLKELGKNKNFIAMVRLHTEMDLRKFTEVLEAENTLAAVSGYEYVQVLRPVLKELCIGGGSYISYLHETTMLILSGAEPGDVLSSYEAKLAKMNGRKVVE